MDSLSHNRMQSPNRSRAYRPALRSAILVLCVAALGVYCGVLVHTHIVGDLPWYGDAWQQSITQTEAKKAFDEHTAIFVDARSDAEYAEGHIPGAYHIVPGGSPDKARQLLVNLPRGTRLITYCSDEGCGSSWLLAGLLADSLGFSGVRVLDGGWPAWAGSTYPVTLGDKP